MTIRQAVSAARDRLSRVQDLELTASLDAELLLLHTLSVPRTTLYAYPSRLLSESEQAAFVAAVERRLRLEPIQYITGSQEFYGLPFEVTPDVLIPRPETELLVEAALERLPCDRPLRIADVGTGSGAIAVALASRLPLAHLVATDLSAEALSIARRNAKAHGVEDRVSFFRGDLLTDLPLNGPVFDAILSNPPYVPLKDKYSLHPQVRDFEPQQALFAGPEGLDVYRQLLPQAWQHLCPAGLLGLEIGFGQQTSLQELLSGWNAVQFLDDLRSIPRAVIARRP